MGVLLRLAEKWIDASSAICVIEALPEQKTANLWQFTRSAALLVGRQLT